MLRDLTPEMLEAIQAGTVRVRFFYEGFYKTGVVRYWTGLGPIEWDGKTWTGQGHVLSLSNIEETTDVKANGISISLSGVKESSVALVLAEGERSKTGKIWLALMYPDDSSAFSLVGDEGEAGPVVGDGPSSLLGEAYPANLVIADPHVVFFGRLDGLDLED